MNEETKQLLSKISQDIDKADGVMYYVGGFVRDILISNTVSKDIDVEIHCIEPETLESILSKYGRVNKVGASFGVYMIEGYDIDFSLPRMERSIGDSHTDFEVKVTPYIGSYNAAKRRDFTMNSLMTNISTGEIIDHFHGVDAITNKTIKHVDFKTFVEDPLRVLRAAQFAARFDFKVDNSTIAICKEMDTSKLSRERILEELKKALLKAERPSIFFETLREMDKLDPWFTDIKKLIGIEQSPKNHPEGDVWNHTMLVLDEAAKVRHLSSNPYYFMMSALCHDLGKIVATNKDENGKITSYEHHLLGRDIAREFLGVISNEKKLMNYVDNMVYLHMKPRMMFKDGSKNNAYRRLIRDSIEINDLLLLTKCDSLGRTDVDTEDTERTHNLIKERVDEVRDQVLPYIHGRDLIELGFKPGKELGVLLKEAFELQLDGLDREEILNIMDKKER